MIRKIKIDKKHLLVIGAAVLIGIFTSLVFTVAVNLIFPQPTFYFGCYRFIAIALTVSSAICLIYYRKYFTENLHKAFLLISLALGISFTLVFPQTVYLSPDDQIHFRNAYIFMDSETELAGGFLAIESSGFIDLEGKGFDELATMYGMMNDANDTVSVEYIANETPQLYKHIVYLPYYIGLKVSAFLHLDFVTSVIIAKLCNLICYIVLVYFAIRESGRMRKIFFVIGLLVSNMFLATQFSYDPIVTASLLLAISLFLHMYQSKVVTKKYLLGFILVATLGSLTKAIYCPLLLLILMIPNSKFDSKKRAIAFKICAILVMIVLASTFVLPVLGGSMAGDVRGGNTSVGGQLQFLLSNPIKSLAIVTNFFVSELPTQLVGTVSLINLGASTSSGFIYDICFPIVSLIWAMSLIVLLWAAFSTDGRTFMTSKLKLIAAIICILLIGMIFASLYLSFTSVGSTKVDGVQPRYFTPLLPLLLLLLVPMKTKIQESVSDKIILFAPSLSLLLVFGIYVLRMSML